MPTLVEQVVEGVRTLSDRQLLTVLDFIGYLKSKTARKNASQPPSGKELLEILQQEGLIEELPDLEAEEEPEFEPILYTGKPLSEMIIEGRGPK